MSDKIKFSRTAQQLLLWWNESKVLAEHVAWYCDILEPHLMDVAAAAAG